MQKLMTAGAILFIGLLFAGTSPAAEWGDLTAAFLFEGTPPKPPEANITTDKPFCCKFQVVDESLLVNEKNGGVANVIVFMYVGRGGKKPLVHESYAATEKAEVMLDNEHCRFDPHVTLLRTTQTLVASNSDEVGHNTNLTTFRNKAYNKLIPSDGQEKLNFPKEEPLPVKVTCNIHPWMGGWLVVKDHPYMGVSDTDGKLVIKNIPVGEVTFQVWHEKAGYLREVTLNGEATEWKRGRLTLEIKPGQNDLGEVKIPASIFE
ncbi:MAG: methylamine utilization protein [Pirellulaceae bacterium]